MDRRDFFRTVTGAVAASVLGSGLTTIAASLWQWVWSVYTPHRMQGNVTAVSSITRFAYRWCKI